jgi:hypothetical protein
MIKSTSDQTILPCTGRTTSTKTCGETVDTGSCGNLFRNELAALVDAVNDGWGMVKLDLGIIASGSGDGSNRERVAVDHD